jgi:hypothetical protein
MAAQTPHHLLQQRQQQQQQSEATVLTSFLSRISIAVDTPCHPWQQQQQHGK